MTKNSGYHFIPLLLLLCLIPVYSSAVIEEKSSVIGNLLDDASQPLAGVTVRLLDSYFLNEIARTQTDSEGKFEVSDVLPGLYLLSVESKNISGFLKRIQVVSGSPTLVDLKPLLSEEELKQHSAWDKFKWTIRVAQRNPLRDDEQTVPAENQLPEVLVLPNLTQGFEASFAYMNAMQANTAFSQQLARVAVQGSWQGEGEWSLQGNILDGGRASYSATGDFEYKWYGHKFGAAFSANDLLYAEYPVSHRPIASFLNSPEIVDNATENTTWVTSVDLADQWQLRQLTIGYGTRLDYHGYLPDPVSYSPRLQLSYQLTPTVAVHGLYYRNQSAPGNYFLHAKDVQPFSAPSIAFVPYRDNLNSEITTGYEGGLSYAGQSFSISASYYHEDILNKIAAVDIGQSAVQNHLQAVRPFLIFNAHDLRSHGMEVQVKQQLSSTFTAIGTYHLKSSIPVFIVEKRRDGQRQLFFINGKEHQDFHDIQAGLRASIPASETDFYANWKWSSGSPLVFGRAKESLSALDIELQQGLPLDVFSQSQIKLLLAVQNLLDAENSVYGNADFQREMQYGMPRLFSGGVLVKF